MRHIVLFTFLSFLLLAQLIPASLQCCLVNQCVAPCCQSESVNALVAEEQINCCANHHVDQQDAQHAQQTMTSKTCCEIPVQQFTAWTTLPSEGLQVLSLPAVIQPVVFQSPLSLEEQMPMAHAVAIILPPLASPQAHTTILTRQVRLLI